jgi:2-keto-3-deoxy-L-fuconate dehydrogenase
MNGDGEQPYRLDGKIALVTGGASGIGAATARELARAGAEVVIADVNLEAAEGLAGEVPRARAVRMDVTEAASIGAALDQISTLDILVNNAGIGMVGDLASTGEDDFEQLMRVNVHGVYLVTRAMLPMLLMSHGCIVNIGSVAGMVGVKQQGCGAGHDAADCGRLSEGDSLQLHRAGDRADALCRGLSRQVSQAREG